MNVGSAEIDTFLQHWKSNSGFPAFSVYLSSHLLHLSVFADVSQLRVVDPPDTQESYIQTLVLRPAFLLNSKCLPSVSKGAAEYRSSSKNSKCC